MKTLQVPAVLATSCTLILCHAIQIEYFVKPNDSTPCPGFPCHTLSHYLESTTQYFASNTRISFLPGVHEVDKTPGWHIKDVSNLTLAGYNVFSSHDACSAKIVCVKPATLIFQNAVNLVIKHLSIIYCGLPLRPFDGFDGLGSSAAVHLVDITSLKLLSISVENSTGYGIVGSNILGNSSVSHSKFVFNNYYTLSPTICSYGIGSCKGGNMRLQYVELSESVSAGSTSVLRIDSCVFSDV